MNKSALLAAAAGLVLACPAGAQEYDVTRRAWTFLEDRLRITVVGEAAGGMQLVRGEPGRVEVAARSDQGLPGFGLGGTLTRELRLTSVGAADVSFLVVVPDRVLVTVELPDGNTRVLSSTAPVASFDWGERTAGRVRAEDLPLAPTLPNGLYLVHATRWAPAVVDVPELMAVRSISVRFEGADFRIAASRPLALQDGDQRRLIVSPSGDPLDLVLYVPRGTAAFTLRSGDRVLAVLMGGRARTSCDGVIIQRPTAGQEWLTFHPWRGALQCR